MRPADVAVIVSVAAAAAMAAGLVGLVVVRLIRRWSIRWQLAVVAVIPVAGACLGALAVARLMFLSTHDLAVMTLVTSVATVVAVGAALIVAAAITRWSEALHDQVRSFGTDGSRPARAGGPAELRKLSEELTRTQRTLDEARTRERRLQESRRELVSWVSHDLRTPLAGLRAMTEALEDGMSPDPARYHRQIRAEVDLMTQMVDDLFELSRINAGSLRLTPEPVLLGDVVSEAIAGADLVARGRGVRLGGHVEDGVEVLADPSGLARVIGNLTANAIRHTPAGGSVDIAGRATPDGVEISVSDGCGGIPPEDMVRVFDVAWQSSAARTPQPSGGRAGLGLAIVKGIVEAHQGRVRVENLQPATGCRFLVTLPM